MDQRISIVTLGVADLARARAFHERLGWRGQQVDDTVFFQASEIAGVFRDPDGHPWEVAHNPGIGLADDGSLVLPDFGGNA